MCVCVCVCVCVFPSASGDIRITVHSAPLSHLSNYLVTCKTHEDLSAC